MDIETQQYKTRRRHIDQARQLAMYFAKKFTKASLASIGSQIGKRDHATVLHACKTVDNLTFTDKQFRKYVEDLIQKITPQLFIQWDGCKLSCMINNFFHLFIYF